MNRKNECIEQGKFLGRMARALVRRAEGGDLDALVALVEAQRAMAAAVKEAGSGLHEHYSWSEIGSSIGTSKQAAEKRFGS
ncbi:hypothetical protein [Nocardioides sp. LML1-1-1.1]|uniref:hypothetical protein n=1 Tax=Nocardioides sp. LML1-1-1.1 TaxID=3135248 RepID=UPI0034351035